MDATLQTSFVRWDEKQLIQSLRIFNRALSLSRAPTQGPIVKGIWIWPKEPEAQDKVLRTLVQEDELGSILSALSKNPDGMSNAQLDRLLANNSQWRTLTHMRELVALGFVEYHVEFFGNAGQYRLTDLGKSILTRIRATN